jgi:uncharacterized membrane protein YphA (DoxX/SURF4 family)
MNALSRFADPVYCILRLISGLLMATHGAQKVFGMFGGKVAAAPHMMFAGWVELVGGLFIAFGLLTRPMAFLCSGLMAAAYFMAHAPGGWHPVVNKGELAWSTAVLFMFFLLRSRRQPRSMTYSRGAANDGSGSRSQQMAHSAGRVRCGAPICARAGLGEAAARELAAHGEWVEYNRASAPCEAFVVYPERKEKTPVVIVIHEIFGLTDWVRGVCDQLAEAGVIAIAPDMLSGQTFPDVDGARKAIGALPKEQVIADLNATAEYAATIPASNGVLAVSGFCWGGGWTSATRA